MSDADTRDLVQRKTLARIVAAGGLPPSFASLSASQRIDAISRLPNPEAFVKGLRPDEFYMLVKGVGLSDGAALLPYASPEQRMALADHEVWSGWEYRPERFDDILLAASSVSRELARVIVRETDSGMLALHLLKTCRFYPVRDVEEGDAQVGEHSFLTPDGQFMVDCPEPELVERVRNFLDLLYEGGIERAHEVIFGGMYEIRSSLEEDVFRLRDARMQDFGFPPFSERYELWEPFDVASLEREGRLRVSRKIVEQRGHPLGLALARTGPRLFLWRAAARIESTLELADVVNELSYLVNRVFAALFDDLSDEGARQASAAHATAMASLGLERLSRGDEDAAATILKAAAPIELYRTGIETVRPVNLKAREAARLAGGGRRLDVLDDDLSEPVRAALSWPPRFWEGLSMQGAVGLRDFLSPSDVEEALAAVGDAVDVLSFAADRLGYRVDESREGGGTTIGQVLATAWAWTVLNGEPSLAPMRGSDVADLVAVAFENGRIRQSLRASDHPSAGVRKVMERALKRVEEALGGLDPGTEPESRFLGRVFLFVEDD